MVSLCQSFLFCNNSYFSSQTNAKMAWSKRFALLVPLPVFLKRRAQCTYTCSHCWHAHIYLAHFQAARTTTPFPPFLRRKWRRADCPPRDKKMLFGARRQKECVLANFQERSLRRSRTSFEQRAAAIFQTTFPGALGEKVATEKSNASAHARATFILFANWKCTYSSG